MVAGRLRLQKEQVQDIFADGKGCTELERILRSKIDSFEAQLSEPLLADSAKLNLGSVYSLRANQCATIEGSLSQFRQLGPSRPECEQKSVAVLAFSHSLSLSLSLALSLGGQIGNVREQLPWCSFSQTMQFGNSAAFPSSRPRGGDGQRRGALAPGLTARCGPTSLLPMSFT